MIRNDRCGADAKDTDSAARASVNAGAKFVPASPGWGQIDSSLVLPTMFPQVISGRKGVAAAAGEATKKMNDAFTEAS